MYCRSCNKRKQSDFLRFCDACKLRWKEVEVFQGPWYETYLRQREKCASCGSFEILNEMLPVHGDLLCIRCDCALYRLKNWTNIQSAITYLSGEEDTFTPKTKRSLLCKITYRICAGMGWRGCSDCDKWKRGGGSYCRACKNKHSRDLYPYRKRRRELYATARNTCAICRKSGRKLVIDHNHQTGAFRGILCNTCNSAIGMLRDSREMLSRLGDYVRMEPRTYDPPEDPVISNCEYPKELEEEEVRRQVVEQWSMFSNEPLDGWRLIPR